jgi:hypothetical protein
MANLSAEMRQERESRRQLIERLEKDLHWVVDGVPTDLGEDLHVRVFERNNSTGEDQPTGLTFDVQLKSTTNLDKHRLKKSSGYSYRLEVKDLLDWEVSTTPIIIIVWDINQKIGCWESKINIIAALDKDNPGWREKQPKAKVSVHLPEKNTTDDNGIALLRLQLICECQSTLKRWFFKQFRLSIPDTQEARPDYEAVMRYIETGAPATISAEYLELNERDARLLGPLLSWFQTLSMGLRPSEQVFPIKLEAASAGGKHAEIPYIKLRLVQRGLKQLVFANGHKAIMGVPERRATPLLFTLTQEMDGDAPVGSPVLGFSTSNCCPTTQELEAALPFLELILTGAEVRITYLDSDGPHEDWAEAPRQGNGLLPDFKQLITVLRTIERRTGCNFRIPGWRISEEDADTAEIILAAVATGRVFLSNTSVSWQLNKKALREDPDQMNAILTSLKLAGGYIPPLPDTGEITLTLLGTEVPLGLCVSHVSGYLTLSPEELRSAILAGSPDEELWVELTDTRTMMECLKWLNE